MGSSYVPINIAGKEYQIDQMWNHSTADLRVAKLQNANLAQYVNIFTDANELTKDLIISGYGRGRGTILQTAGTTYGYTWASSGNTTKRWATNKVNGYFYDIPTVSYISDVMSADFDGLGEGNSTTYEATLANYDSGLNSKPIRYTPIIAPRYLLLFTYYYLLISNSVNKNRLAVDVIPAKAGIQNFCSLD